MIDGTPTTIFYPASPSAPTAPRPRWLGDPQLKALGRAQLGDKLGCECCGVCLMTCLGGCATGWLRLPAEEGLPALTPPDSHPDGWPVALFTHSLTGWAYHNSAHLLEICSHGAVVIALTHTDGTACTATDLETGKEIARYIDWETEKVPEIAAKHEGTYETSPAFKAEVHGWRHGQVDHRYQQMASVLAGANDALDRAGVTTSSDSDTNTPSRPASTFARVEREVAVLGMSFGGASATAFSKRDPLGRVAHLFLLDPWIDGKDEESMLPMTYEEFSKPFNPTLKTVVCWRNKGSALWGSCGPNCETLADKVKEMTGDSGSAVLHDLPEPHSHFAQTDVPSVFENGPLACVYSALFGGGETPAGQMSSREVLALSVEQTVECLEANGWFPPKQPVGVAAGAPPPVTKQPLATPAAMEQAKDEGMAGAGAAGEEEVRAPSSV
eukprot:CAMPEP_0182565556 /NCGR_PEP_ID=MMETSP1324-20130603/7241_1 /TAXON_ID=236786 /ORGANISM="Florenciella sp., Strain RCC1587" /LENGTH=440 /DNA_ID=CAMNT_0024779229 /DNA_START=340 /DNA_END=1662 /DNA_ORIENTATION=+